MYRSIERAVISTVCALALLVLLSSSVGAQPSMPDAPPPRFGRVTQPHVRSANDRARAIAYQRSGRALSLVETVWSIAGLWLLLRTGISAKLRDAALRVTRARPRAGPGLKETAGYFAGFVLLTRLWSLPFTIANWSIEHTFGFSSQSVAGLLRDQLLDWALDLLWIPVVWLAYRFYARAPKTWWKLLLALVVPLFFLEVVAYPVVIAPMFNTYRPLPNGPLRDELLALAGRAGITGANVYVENTSARTSHVNAYVAGLGPTTRIVLNDTALRELPEDELLVVMGHEMGHYVEGHIWIKFGAGAFGAWIFLWIASKLLPLLVARGSRTWRVTGVTDLAALPAVYLLLSVFLIIQSPIEAAMSRTLEARADAFGLRITGLPDAAVRLYNGFEDRDLVDPDPPALLQFWFGTHPTLRERIQYARSLR